MRRLCPPPSSFKHALTLTFRWFAATGDTKLLQTLLIQGQGWVRGYAAAALVECIKVLSGAGSSSSSGSGGNSSGGGGSSSSGSSGTSKDVAAILLALFEVFTDDKVPSCCRLCCGYLFRLLHHTPLTALLVRSLAASGTSVTAAPASITSCTPLLRCCCHLI